MATAIPLETAAVLEYFKPHSPVALERIPGYEFSYEINGGRAVVWVVELGTGNVASAISTERAIGDLEPDAAILVGIAGGVKDVDLGMVVLANKLYEYETKRDDAIERPRPDAFHSDYELLVSTRSACEKLLGEAARPRIGPIASGSTLVGSHEAGTFEYLRRHFSDAIAVEMEGYGFLRACADHRVPALVIRGISDLVENKHETDAAGYQQQAAAAAAAVMGLAVAEIVATKGNTREPETELYRQIFSRTVDRRLSMDNVPKDGLISTALFERLDEFRQLPTPRCMTITGPTGSGKTVTTLAWSIAREVPVLFVDAVTIEAAGPLQIESAVRASVTSTDSAGVLDRSPSLRDLGSLPAEACPMVIVDAPNELADGMAAARGLRQFVHDACSAGLKVLVLCRDSEWGNFAPSMPDHWFYAPGREKDLVAGMQMGVLTDLERDSLAEALAEQFDVTFKLIGDALEQARHPGLIRLFVESAAGESPGDVSDLGEAISSFVGAKVRSASLDRPGLTGRWAGLRDSISEALWSSSFGRAIPTSVLAEHIGSADLEALLKSGLMVERLDPTSETTLVSLISEAMDEWFLTTWLLRENGYDSSQAALAGATTQTSVDAAHRYLLTRIAGDRALDAADVLRVAANHGPHLFRAVAARVAQIEHESDVLAAASFAERYRFAYALLLRAWLPDSAARVYPFVEPADTDGLSMWVSASTDLRDLAYSLHCPPEPSGDVVDVVDAYPQSHIALGGMPLIVTYLVSSDGATPNRIYKRLDRGHGPSPRRPELAAAEDILNAIQLAAKEGALGEPIGLAWERVNARLAKLGIPLSELTEGRLDKTWKSFRPSNLDPQALSSWDNDLGLTFADLDRLQTATYVPPGHVPISSVEADGKRRYPNDTLTTSLGELVGESLVMYEVLCRENFSPALKEDFPLARLAPLTALVISDEVRVRVIVLPWNPTQPDPRQIQIAVASEFDLDGKIRIGNDPVDVIVRTEFAERAGREAEPFEFEITMTLEELYQDGMPKNEICKRLLAADLEAANQGSVAGS